MAGVPALPSGYVLDGPPRDPNLLKPLLDAGAVPTNGYRTPGDIERLKRAGYTPSNASDHLRGDAVDLVPGKSGLTLAQLAERTQQRIGSRGTAKVHNGNHVHTSVPGWGMAAAPQAAADEKTYISKALQAIAFLGIVRGLNEEARLIDENLGSYFRAKGENDDARRRARAAIFGALAGALQQSAQQPLIRPPTTVRCDTYGASTTCRGQ